MKTQSAQFLKRRKFLLVLPLLVLPFIALGFLALGGGSGKKDNTALQQGLNPRLPDARLSSDPSDKMSLYNKAARDSAEKNQNNPLYKADSIAAYPKDSSYNGRSYPADSYGSGGHGISPYQDPNELKVKDRLARLEDALNRPVPVSSVSNYPQSSLAGTNPDIEKLEQLIHAAGNSNGADSETQQLSELMDKLMDLQYPERAQQKLKEQSKKNKGRVYSVGIVTNNKEVPLLQGSEAVLPSRNGDRTGAHTFYDIDSEVLPDTDQTAIPAVIHETQTLVSGATVKMRLSEAIFINGVQIPAGNFVYGVCNVNGERLKIDINSVRYGKSLYPVALGVYDLDALEGIRIPGAITRDAAKEGADRGLQGVQLMSLDPSIGAQAAGAGVEMAKGLFSKKVKLIRVTVKAGYPILLMDEKARQQQSN